MLSGDMSMVGPPPLPWRPSLASANSAACAAASPGHDRLAQVNGNTRLSDEEKIALDLWYVAHAGLWLDARILC
ncbi:hypothetical protein F2981_20145 (plasmid) [Sinorhizobium meliloti]|nr:hypothetical protein [Sinorhizobium meliloti]